MDIVQLGLLAPTVHLILQVADQPDNARLCNTETI